MCVCVYYVDSVCDDRVLFYLPPGARNHTRQWNEKRIREANEVLLSVAVAATLQLTLCRFVILSIFHVH